MADITHDFVILAPIEKVYEILVSPDGMAEWWTLVSEGRPLKGEMYKLDFGPGYVWAARVIRADAPVRFSLEMVDAAEDWLGTEIQFALEDRDYCTGVRFRHASWQAETDHFRTSSYCWAMYLRILKRFIESGEQVAYADRLKA